jgi:hypothetical protein
MSGAQGEGRGARGEGKGKSTAKSAAEVAENDRQLEQIEYLLHQSTQGIHFIFDHSEVAKVLSQPSDDGTPSGDKISIKKMEQVQGLLSGFLEKPSMAEKRSYLEKLKRGDYELLMRAYFQLVDNTILTHSSLKH